MVLAAGLSCLAAPASAGEPAILAAIESLGRANGQALACNATAASAQARELVLKLAPRTTEAGAAFERGTQAGYAELLRSGGPCPEAAQFAASIAVLGQQLEASLHEGGGG